MASVTLSEVFRNRLLANGRRRIRFKYTIEDNDLNTEVHITTPFHRPGAWDVAGNLSGYADAYLDALQTLEVNQAHRLALTPEDEIENLTALQAEVFNKVDSPRYAIKKRLQKKLIYYLMNHGDAQYALNVKSVWDDLPPLDAGKKNRLDINQTQLDRLGEKRGGYYRGIVYYRIRRLG